MRKITKIQRKEEKGITLIALVITIVVLLILAAVSIATLTGENGILTRANDAKTETEEAKEDELRRLTALEAATNLEDTTYIDNSTEEEKTVTIPAETAVSQVEGENTLKDGLVIIDKNGNEWVWIEVPRTVEVYQIAGTELDVDNITDDQCSTIYDDLANYATEYRDSNYSDTFYSGSGFNGEPEYNTTKNNMLRSVYRYGGFWIGRYEVGDADATASNTTRTSSTGASNTAVIKANYMPYNLITCSQAQELATGLSTGGKTSSLMFGIQWDLTCKFLETKGRLTQEQIKTDSKEWGNYSNSTILLLQGKYNTNPINATSQWLDITQGPKNGTMLLTTGASEDTNKMNIYDFAGNVWEWTLERYTINTNGPCAHRGGGYNGNSSSFGYPAFGRSNYGTTSSSNSLGFRPSLY